MVISPLRPQVLYVKSGAAASSVRSVDFSPTIDGKPATFKLNAGRKAVTALAAHTAKPLLATGDVRGRVRIWEYDTHSLRYVLDEPLGAVGAVIGSGGKDGGKAKALTHRVTALVFHPYKDILIIGTSTGCIAAWDVGGVQSGTFLGARDASAVLSSTAVVAPPLLRPAHWSGVGSDASAPGASNGTASNASGAAAVRNAARRFRSKNAPGASRRRSSNQASASRRGDGTGSEITCLAFHPLSVYFFSLSGAGEVRTWKLGLGRQDERIKLINFLQVTARRDSFSGGALLIAAGAGGGGG